MTSRSTNADVGRALRAFQRSVCPPGRRIEAKILPDRMPIEIPPEEHRRALGRRATSEWRERLAERGEPETVVVAKALLRAYIELLIEGDDAGAAREITLYDLTDAMLRLLVDAGFSAMPTKRRLARLMREIRYAKDSPLKLKTGQNEKHRRTSSNGVDSCTTE